MFQSWCSANEHHRAARIANHGTTQHCNGLLSWQSTAERVRDQRHRQKTCDLKVHALTRERAECGALARKVTSKIAW
jgi:hypothetical protein